MKTLSNFIQFLGVLIPLAVFFVSQSTAAAAFSMSVVILTALSSALVWRRCPDVQGRLSQPLPLDRDLAIPKAVQAGLSGLILMPRRLPFSPTEPEWSGLTKQGNVTAKTALIKILDVRYVIVGLVGVTSINLGFSGDFGYSGQRISIIVGDLPMRISAVVVPAWAGQSLLFLGLWGALLRWGK